MRAAGSERTSPVSVWVSRIALFSLGLVITAAILHRLFGMPTPTAFNLVRAGYLGVALTMLAALVATVRIWRTGEGGAARIVFGVGLGLTMLAGPMALAVIASEYPPINDVSTDTATPPEFRAIAQRRGGGTNPVDYPASFAAEQLRSYPDVRPLRLNRSPQEAFELAVETVKKQRMTVVREVGPTDGNGGVGVIEAVDRTLVAGFYDDVALRVTGDDGGARVDIRSAARYDDWSELGRNAERVRMLAREIAMRVDTTVPSEDAAKTKGGKDALKRRRGDDALGANRRKPRDRVR